MAEDRYLKCESCGTRFIWTGSEQEPEAPAPARCPGCRSLLPEPGRHRGLVKFYNARKGWGFIVQTQGRELFFHRSALADEGSQGLHDGELVEYAIQQTGRGPQAVGITRLEQPDATGADPGGL